MGSYLKERKKLPKKLPYHTFHVEVSWICNSIGICNSHPDVILTFFKSTNLKIVYARKAKLFNWSFAVCDCVASPFLVEMPLIPTINYIFVLMGLVDIKAWFSSTLLFFHISLYVDMREFLKPRLRINPGLVANAQVCDIFVGNSEEEIIILQTNNKYKGQNSHLLMFFHLLFCLLHYLCIEKRYLPGILAINLERIQWRCVYNLNGSGQCIIQLIHCTY